MSLRDGLGGEELGQAGSQNSNLWITGSIVSESNISGANIYSTADIIAVDYSGTDFVATGSVISNQVQSNNNVHLAAGSPYGKGVVIQLTARSNISGGMFVSASGNLAYAAPASTKVPLGMAEPGTDVASGATVNVVTHGVVAAVAEGTIAVGAPAMMGAGAALNTVVAATAASGVRVFSVLDAVGSEGTVFISL